MLKALRVLQVVAVDLAFEVLDWLVEHLSLAFVDVAEVAVACRRVRVLEFSYSQVELAIEVIILAEH